MSSPGTSPQAVEAAEVEESLEDADVEAQAGSQASTIHGGQAGSQVSTVDSETTDQPKKNNNVSNQST